LRLDESTFLCNIILFQTNFINHPDILYDMDLSSNLVNINRELSGLDKFALRFCSIIERYIDYVIVSGYVSILLGRSRASEDIDMIIPYIDTDSWKKIYSGLIKNGYYCLNASTAKKSYEYLKDAIAVRFAPRGKVIPNMEVAFALKDTQKLALSTKLKAIVGKKEIFVSDLELQIAYKELVLKSPKDMEDARHLRVLLGKNINIKKLNKYMRILK